MHVGGGVRPTLAPFSGRTGKTKQIGGMLHVYWGRDHGSSILILLSRAVLLF